MVVSELQQTVREILSFLSELQKKCWYFYSRLRSLLACGLCAASGSSLSVACGLLCEVYIQPRPPCSKLESVRGWRTEVNETAPRRGGRGGGVVCGGEVFVCARAGASVSAHGGGRNLKRREGSVQGDRDKRS